MQRNIFFYCLLVISISLLAACSSKTPKELKLIPNNASVMVSINAGLLHNKLLKAGIAADSIVRKLIHIDTANADLMQHYNDLLKAGIDWNNHFTIFRTTKVYPNKSFSNFTNIIIGITDSAKLSAYLTTIDYLKGRNIHQEKNYAYIQMDGNGIVSWNKQDVIVTMQEYTEQPRGLFPDSTMQVNQPDVISKVDELQKEVNRFYNLSSSASLGAMPLVQSLFKTAADGYFYNTTTDALNTFNTGMLQLPKLADLLNNNITTATFNFDEGAIVAHTNFYPNKLMKAIFETYKSGNVKTALVGHYPSKNIDMAILLAFNPKIIDGILQQLDMAPLVDGFLDKAGMPASAIYDAFTGDMAVVLSDLNLKKDSVSKNNWGKFLINMPIGNSASFHKIMDKAADAGWVVKQNNTYAAGKIMEAVNISLISDNKNLIITNDTGLLKTYKSNTAPIAFSDDVLQQMKGSQSFFYGDIDKIIHAFTIESTQSNAPIQHTFKDAFIKGNAFDGTVSKGTYKIRMQNAQQNSLVSILQLFPYIAEQIQKNRNARKNIPGDANESIFNVPFSSRLGSL